MLRRAGMAVAATALLGVALAPAAGATSPGTNGPIVFESYAGDSLEVWIMDADGSNPDAVTNTTSHSERPSISADAQRIAFQSYRAGDGDEDSFEIYTVNVNGSGTTALTDDDDTDFEPSWAPDGTKVIFLRSAESDPGPQGSGADLWTVNANGTGETNLTNTPIAYECCAEYSPDGTKVAFTNSGHVDGNPMGDYDTNNIWVMNANGTGQTQLTFDDSPNGNIQPTWSPDGDQIAFLHTTSTSQDVWVMDANGDNQTPITATVANEYSPVWSPDGTLLAFEQGLGDDEIATSGITLSPPGAFTNLTNNSVNDGYPSWAPAGGGGGAPDTKITKKPKDVIHKDKATYEFEAIPAAGATFKCKLDDAGFKSCESPKTYKHLKKGKHKFQVRATAGGQTDPTPAKDSFKVKP